MSDPKGYAKFIFHSLSIADDEIEEAMGVEDETRAGVLMERDSDIKTVGKRSNLE